MKLSHGVALHVSPVVLRLVVGLTFVWAGLGKVLTTFEPTPEQAVMLGEIGVLEPSDGEPEHAGEGAESEETGFEGIEGVSVERRDDAEAPSEAATVRSVHHVSLLVYSAATAREDGSWTLAPGFLSGGYWPVVMGWLAAVTELLAGLGVLGGLLTRLMSLSLAWVMVVAVWLTQIGPAVQAGTATWGFLPAGGIFDPAAMSVFLWQVAVLGMCVSLVLSGPGWLSFDRALFRKRLARTLADDE